MMYFFLKSFLQQAENFMGSAAGGVAFAGGVWYTKTGSE
jgi:hypothetical protein